MADVNGWGLVIWNNRRFSRLEARVFNPEESMAHVEIAGESFVLEDSLMGMAVSPKIYEYEGSDLIFRPFASRALYAADTRVLARSTYGDTVRYKESSDMMPSQATAMGITSRGTLFFGLTSDTAIGCWNRYRDMTSDQVVSLFIHIFYFQLNCLNCEIIFVFLRWRAASKVRKKGLGFSALRNTGPFRFQERVLAKNRYSMNGIYRM